MEGRRFSSSKGSGCEKVRVFLVDDRTHRATWDLLCQLTGRRDFLYVADFKLATAENMAYIQRHGGRFLSVLPRTRGEDAAFRAEILSGRVQWRRIHDKYDDDGELVDRFSIHEPELTSVEGYRLIWYQGAGQGVIAVARRARPIGLRAAPIRALEWERVETSPF
jgi:hypothetical protein